MRCHLWAEIWMRLPANVVGIKMPAHVSWKGVKAGKAQAWQKRASDTVDYWAKQGARRHRVTMRAKERFETCAEVAVAAATWAAKQEAYLADNELRDADELLGHNIGPQARAREVKLPDRWAVPESGGAVAGHEEKELALAMAQRGHKLVCCRYQQGGTKYLVGCLTCGAYAASRPEGLRHECPGKPPTRGRAQQRSDLLRGLHPLRGANRPVLDLVRPATAPQLAWVARAWSASAAADLTRPLELACGALEVRADAWSRRTQLLAWQLDAFGGEGALSRLEEGASDTAEGDNVMLA